MTTEEQIKALQAEVDGLRLAFAQYHTQVAEWRDRMQQVSDKMVEVSSESTQRFIEPAIKHQLMCEPQRRDSERGSEHVLVAGQRHLQGRR